MFFCLKKNKFFLVFEYIFLVAFSVYAEDDDEFNLNYILNDKAFVFDVEAEYNYWMPNECYFLNYDIQGLPLLKVDAKATIDRLPEFCFQWETNLKKSTTNDILAEHNSSDGVKAFYNKFRFFLNLGEKIGQLSHYNPWRNNRSWELSYIRETFRISVSPSLSNIYYMDETGNVSFLDKSDSLTMYTKFEEVAISHIWQEEAHGILILPALINIMFSRSSDANIGFSNLDTSFGAYFNTWQKPYSVTQIISAGEINGYSNVVYAARFFSVGLTEQLWYASKYFYFKNKMNMGIAWVKLTDSQKLSDSSSPVFMQFNIYPQMGLHLPIVDKHFYLNVFGSCDWGCMLGVTINSTSESLFTFSGLINSDILCKVSISASAIF